MSAARMCHGAVRGQLYFYLLSCDIVIVIIVYRHTAVMCSVDNTKTSCNTTQQLSLLADTYSLTCDIVMHDAAAIVADTDTVRILTEIAGCRQTDTHNQVSNGDVYAVFNV